MTAVHDVFGNADLFQIFFAGIGVVGVDDDGRVRQLPFGVRFQQVVQVFVMVVRQAVSEVVDVAAQDGMS